MSIRTLLADLRAQHDSGTFVLNKSGNLRALVREVPAEYGVYVVHAYRGRSRELVYIGKAGTLQQNGEVRTQTLPKRMVNRQNGMSRARFFAERIAEENLDQLHFEWFVTFEHRRRGVPPFLPEAQLLAAHLDAYGYLPRWNKGA